MTEFTIYIDIYLFLNLFINWFILFITSLLINRQSRFAGFFIADIIASFFGLVICLPSMSIYLSLAVKFISAIFISIAAFGNKGILYILKNAFIYLSISTTYSALTIWGSSVFKLKSIIYINNNEIYYNLPVSFLILLLMFLMIFYSIIKKILVSRNPTELLYDCFIELNGKNTEIKAFLDTGNSLKDIITGLPVIIIGPHAAESILSDLNNFLELRSYTEKLKIVPYRTADGRRSLLPAFKPDKVTLNGNEVDVIVAVSKEDLDMNNNEFNCLLSKNCIQ